MAQTIKLKRSSSSDVSGIPTTSQLSLGEIAINTYHGKMYIKKNDGADAIVELGADRLSLSGGILTGTLSVHAASPIISLKDTSDDDDHHIYFRNASNTILYEIATQNSTSGDAFTFFSSSNDIVTRIDTTNRLTVDGSGITVTGNYRVGGTEVISASGVWTGPSTGLKGEVGPKGQKGEFGAQGAAGANGQKGAQGAQGIQGIQGIQGGQGQKGELGAQGAQGAQGIQGIQGGQGQKGEIGAKGAQGIQGVQGIKGQKGELGAQGAQGIQGIQGGQGQKGEIGAKGAQGAQGVKGQKGEVGAQGVTGAKGQKGEIGAQGAKGQKGQSHYIGTVSGVSSSGWTTAFTVNGDNLASGIRFTAHGTTDNVVVTSMVDVIASHSKDFTVTSQSGFYTTLSLRFISSDNEDYAVQMKTNHANSVSLALEVFPFNSEVIAFTSSHSFSGTTFDHVCYGGLVTSGTGSGNAGDFRAGGDIYVGNTTKVINDDGTWAGASSGLKGEVGLQGVQGAKGQKGEIGAQGAQGQKGEIGAQGAQGQKGEIGAQGAQGGQGIQGGTGAKGQKGEIGAQGAQGIQGIQGIQGGQGAQGQKGEIGAQGIQGVQGQKGEIGAQGAQGAQGQKGEIGAQGIQGGTGAKGQKGEIGAQGGTGAKGQKGEIGAQGAQGIQGVQGIKGQKGEIGAQGGQGIQGIQGIKGQKGQTGAQGGQGIQGGTGAKGQKGEWGGTATTHVDMSNYNISGVNSLSFEDPGPNEGLHWAGGNIWKIYESPDDLTTNTGGNLQFVSGATSARRMTLDTSGNLDLTGSLTVAGDLNITGDINSISVTNLDVADKTIRVGVGQTASASGGSGLVIDRGTSADASLLWNQSNTRFDLTNNLNVDGSFSATTKSFDIEHPTKEGMRLHHGSLEGPEHGVYIRGKNKGNVIELPDYWLGLVDENTITVQLTAIGMTQDLCVREIKDNKVYVKGIEYFYFVQAERKDIEKFKVEYNAN